MNKDQQTMYDDIIRDFEQSYHETLTREGLVDSPTERATFYQECVALLKYGPRLQSPTVQSALLKYYTDLRRNAYGSIIDEMKIPGWKQR